MALGITGSAGGHDVSQRLAKIETAIFRRKTIVFDYYTMERDEVGTGGSIPTSCSTRAASSTWSGARRARGDPGLPPLPDPGQGAYATKAEHDFQRPAEFDPAGLREPHPLAVRRAVGEAEVWIGRRIGWQIERHFGRYGHIRPDGDDGDMVLTTAYANARQLIAWVLGLGEHARILGPPGWWPNSRAAGAADRAP